MTYITDVGQRQRCLAKSKHFCFVFLINNDNGINDNGNHKRRVHIASIK